MHMHVCLCAHLSFAWVYVSIFVCVCMYTCTCVHVHAYMLAHMCICVCACMSMSPSVCTHHSCPYRGDGSWRKHQSYRPNPSPARGPRRDQPPLQQLPSSWVCSRHGQGVALPTHPHCGLPPSQPRAPHVALHPSPQTRRPSLRLAVCILPIEAPWVSHSHRPFYVLATARTFSNCPPSKEEATSQGPTQATFLQRLALHHTPVGPPTPPSPCAPSLGAPIGQGAL